MPTSLPGLCFGGAIPFISASASRPTDFWRARFLRHVRGSRILLSWCTRARSFPPSSGDFWAPPPRCAVPFFWPLHHITVGAGFVRSRPMRRCSGPTGRVRLASGVSVQSAGQQAIARTRSCASACNCVAAAHIQSSVRPMRQAARYPSYSSAVAAQLRPRLIPRALTATTLRAFAL